VFFISFKIQDSSSENSFHRLPLFIAAGGGAGALELGDVGFPLGLPRKGGQTGHIAGKVKVVFGVHNHKETAAFAVYLHIQDAYLTLAFYDLRPHVGVSFNVLLYHLLVIYEREGLAVSLHYQEFEN